MKRFLSLIAALILGAALVVPDIAEAAARRAPTPAGEPFLRGIKNPEELAQKIEASVAKDSTGNSKIDPDQCDRNGSCATPGNYLRTLQKVDPGAHLKHVSELPAFLRKLKRVEPPKGEYWMSCLKRTDRSTTARRHGTFREEIHCIARAFKPGEGAWIDPVTNVLIFAEDCTNVIEKAVAIPLAECAYLVHFTQDTEVALRQAIVGPKPVNDPCLAILRAGETEWQYFWKDECYELGCDFYEPARVVGQPVQLVNSYIPRPGRHIIRVPKWMIAKDSLYRVLLCIDHALPLHPFVYYQGSEEGYHAAHHQWAESYRDTKSDTTGVRWHDYVVRPLTGVPGLQSKEASVAWVYYSQSEHAGMLSQRVNEPPLYWTFRYWEQQHPGWREEAERRFRERVNLDEYKKWASELVRRRQERLNK